MKSKTSFNKPRWWQMPRVLAGWVAGLVAFGAVVIWVATYIGLPDRVAAGEVYDKTQDERFDAYLQEQKEAGIRQEAYTQALNKLLENQNGQLPSVIWQERDRNGCWVCQAERYEQCWEESLWRKEPCYEERNP